MMPQVTIATEELAEDLRPHKTVKTVLQSQKHSCRCNSATNSDSQRSVNVHLEAASVWTCINCRIAPHTACMFYYQCYFRKNGYDFNACNSVRDVLYNTEVINCIAKLIVQSPVGKLV